MLFGVVGEPTLIITLEVFCLKLKLTGSTCIAGGFIEIQLKRERKATIPKRDYASRRLVDTSDEKFQTSPGLKRWATIENLKIAAQSYAEAESITKLEHEISVKPKPANRQNRALWNWNTVLKTL